MSDPDTILLETEEAMEKAVEYLKNELRGIRTGRASTAMVEFVKVEYYGTPTDMKALAAISIPEPTQILIKPFDAGSIGDIKKAIETSGLGFNPNVEGGKQIRLNIPPLSGERRQQLMGKVRKMGEEQKVAIRNVRRDGNKHADGLKTQPGKHVSEDEIETLKNEVQELLKKYEAEVDKRIEDKVKEIEQV
jgi:ribosome recycling factor